MGIRSSSHIPNSKSLFKNFKHEDWIEIKTNNNSVEDIANIYGQYTTLRNLMTDEQIDMFFLYFDNKQQFIIYIECFMERIRENYLVNAIYLQPFTSREGCTSYYTAKCYLQHIPIRLSNITDIPFLDTLYILLCSLLGFQKLFNNVGYFSVAEDHICIDKEGEVRVWMNTDLSKNYPEIYEEIGSKEGQNAMVTQIIDLVFNNSEDISQQQQQDERIISFREYLQQRESNPSFKQALQELYKYLREYEIQLPNYCQSILEIFNEENASYFLPNNDSGIERMLDGSLNTNMSNNDIILNESNMFARKQKQLFRHKNDRNLQRMQNAQQSPHQISSSSKSKFFRNSYRTENSQHLNQPQKQRKPLNSKRYFKMQSSRSQSNHNRIIQQDQQGMDYLEMSNLSSNPHSNQPIEKIPIRNRFQGDNPQTNFGMHNFRGSINNSSRDYLNHAYIESERGFRYTQNTNSHIDNYSRPDHYIQHNEKVEQIPTHRVSHRGSYMMSYKGNADKMIINEQNNRKRFSEQRNSYKIKFTYMGREEDQDRSNSIDQKCVEEELSQIKNEMTENKTDKNIYQTMQRFKDGGQTKEDEREIDPQILADLKQYQSLN